MVESANNTINNFGTYYNAIPCRYFFLMSFAKPYSKNKSIGIPEDCQMTVKEYKEAVKVKKNRNKYNAKSCYYNGYNYHSKLEAAYAKELDCKLQLAEIKSWERQVPLELRIDGHPWRTYVIDFKVQFFEGPPEYVEVKGVQTDSWRQKFDVLKIIREEVLEPGAKIILQFKHKRYVY